MDSVVQTKFELGDEAREKQKNVPTKTMTKLCNLRLHFSDWKSMHPDHPDLNFVKKIRSVKFFNFVKN